MFLALRKAPSCPILVDSYCPDFCPRSLMLPVFETPYKWSQTLYSFVCSFFPLSRMSVIFTHAVVRSSFFFQRFTIHVDRRSHTH